jgi:hypothetical protein
MGEKDSGRTTRWLCLGASALPAFYLSTFVYRFASPLPVHDQWDVVPFIVSMKEGRTSLSLLTQFYGEHLMVIPRLFFAVLACLFTWDNRLECWVTFVFTVAIFSLLCSVAVKAATKGERIAHVALIPISVFLFGTNQWQNWLWGFQLAWPIPVLALIASIAFLSLSNRLAVRLTIIILATVGAVLSMGNGFLVPLILSVILLGHYLACRNGNTFLELALAAALFVVSLILLTSNPSQSEVYNFRRDSGFYDFNFWRVLRGVCLILANPFLDLSLSRPDQLAGSLVLSILISLVLTSFFVWLVLRGCKNAVFDSPLYSMGFALANWAVLSSLMIASARGGNDPYYASPLKALAQSRYISYAVLLPIGLTLMSAAILLTPRAMRRSDYICRAWIYISITLAAWSLYSEPTRLRWGRAMHDVYEPIFSLLKIAPVFPVDAELSRVITSARIITSADRTELIKEVSQHRLIRGMIPPIRRIPERMLVVNDEFGNVDKVTDQLQGGTDIEGWAALPWKHEVPDASFLGNLNEDGSVDLLAPILIHKNRPDIQALGGPSKSGWELHLSGISSQRNIVLVAYEWATNKFYRKPRPIRTTPHNL